MRDKILTTINLVLFLSWATWAVGTFPLGSLEAALRDNLLFRDGSTTITGTLTSSDGASLKINPSGTITVRSIIFTPVTTVSPSELYNSMQDKEFLFWNPGGGDEISMIIRDGSRLEKFPFVKYADADQTKPYYLAIRWNDDLYVLDHRSIF